VTAAELLGNITVSRMSVVRQDPAAAGRADLNERHRDIPTRMSGGRKNARLQQSSLT
jgi:hypothetical protein